MRRAIVIAILAAACAETATEQTVRITIPAGATLSGIADTLAANGIVRSASLFQFYARLTGRQRLLQAGIYELPLNGSPRTVVEMMTSGRTAMERLIIPEGLMLSEIVSLVSELGVPPDSFRAATRDTAVIASLGVTARTLEGYLYPSTYFVPVHSTARQIVRQLVAEFQDRWNPEWDERAVELGLSRHEVVTLASIIEGEVLYGPDRPYVSSVYHNRLSRGMRLQADPTVIYSLGTRRRLYERDYLTPSEYNTYLIDGLPPGPIGQPSAQSIEAALFPASTDFLFIVADTTGKHIFSRTLREHSQRVRELRRIWSEIR